MRSPLLLLLLLCVSGCSLSGAGAALITHPLRIPVVGAPAAPHQDLTIATDDGLQLDGWLFPPEGAPGGLVVLLHGKDINRQHLAGEAGRFTGRGYAVLAYDQRAHGRSGGELVTYGVREVPDLQRAIAQVGLEPVYVIGESLGAAVALQAAAREPKIRGVVAGAAFAELPAIITERSPFGPGLTAESLAAAEARWGFKAAQVSPARDAASITVPVLLLHGTADTFIKPEHSRRIFAALAGPKRLVWLDGVSHQAVLLHQEAWRVIDAWLCDVAAGGDGAATAVKTGCP